MTDFKILLLILQNVQIIYWLFITNLWQQANSGHSWIFFTHANIVEFLK